MPQKDGQGRCFPACLKEPGAVPYPHHAGARHLTVTSLIGGHLLPRPFHLNPVTAMSDTSMRLRLLLAYDGSRYHGWQIQEIPTPPPTVQAAVETAVGRIAGRPVRVFGSGRTDAGVHAHGQVAHCDVPRRPGLDWRHALNALLPGDVRVLHWQEAAPDFHARISALRKTYVYDFWQEKGFVPPRLAPFVWRSGPLDADAMRAALPYLLGRHDFASFQNAGTEMESTVRELQVATLTERPPVEFMPPCLPCLRLSVTANGFLKQMVRNMAGLLAACGRHKLRPDQIPAILEAADRRALPSPTAPPQGLALAHVEYPD